MSFRTFGGLSDGSSGLYSDPGEETSRVKRHLPGHPEGGLRLFLTVYEKREEKSRKRP